MESRDWKKNYMKGTLADSVKCRNLVKEVCNSFRRLAIVMVMYSSIEVFMLASDINFLPTIRDAVSQCSSTELTLQQNQNY